jgi:tetratricopeptide (TPR) repeat protein
MSARSGEADALLADVWWSRGERDRCFEHLSRAEELVRDAPPSAAKALVLSQVARFRALAGEVDEPIRIGSEALAIAEKLGLDELRAHALNNIGIAKGNAGDTESAIADDERSIEIALSINSPEAARGYNNLSAMLWYAGELPRSHELREETMRIAERLGAVSIYRYARSNLPLYLYPVGRWDEAVRLADEIVAECESDPYMGEAYVRRARALIRLARDDRAGALDDARRCLDVARRVKDPQTLLPALAVGVRVNFELGLGDVARQTGAELVCELNLHPVSFNVEWVPLMGRTVTDVGIAEGISEALEPHRGNPWVDVGLAVVGERFSDAADRLRAIGDVASEADARRWAAEQLAAAGRRAEASAELDLALAFYRSVGATRYIGQGEALLAKTA